MNRTALPPPAPVPSGRKLVREIFGLVLLFWAAFLLLALLSFSPQDPSINHIVSRGAGTIRNSGGMFGACVSGLLVDVFGLGAFAWPVAFAVWGGACVSTWFSMPWWRWLGFALFGACLMTLGASSSLAVMDVRGGGMLGVQLAASAAMLIGAAGSALLWLFAFFLALELGFGISWMALLSALGGLVSKRLAARGLSLDKAMEALRARWRRGSPEPATSEEAPIISLLDVEDDEENPAEVADPLPSRVGYAYLSTETIPPVQPPVHEDPPWLPAAKNAGDTDVAAPDPAVPATPDASPAAPLTSEEALAGDRDLLSSIMRRLGRTPKPAAPDAAPDVTPAPAAPLLAANAATSPAAAQGKDVPNDFFDTLDRALNAGQRPEGPAPGLASVAVNGAPARPLPQKPCVLPDTSLLSPATGSDSLPSRDSMRHKGEQLMSCLADFNISAELVRVTPGPVVTMFELRPAPGTKVSRIIGLNEDIALNLKALAVRIQTTPGSDTVGVEIPNERRATVNFRSILESDAFDKSASPLTLTLGVSIGGEPTVADLAKMPHLLVGGTTGSGKSVCINAFLLSLLYKTTPDELKLLMVDPKRVELAMYADLPHLIHPVVNEPALAKNALDWAVHEMEHRYDLLARLGVRKFDAYNARLREMGGRRPPELADLTPMPYLVIVVDELADLMMSAGKEVEASIVRLAQLARAAGIHLIVATQRPSVDVVTGLIKANFPSRVSFQVTNGHDSRTILDATGAELLLGKGDMLFKPSGSKPFRLHGPFVPDADVEAVVDFWKAQRKPEYTVDFAEWGQPAATDPRGDSGTAGQSEEADLYNDIVQFALAQGKGLSISKLQRQFRIGFNKAARFMEQMEQDGVIAPAGHANRSRDVVN